MKGNLDNAEPLFIVGGIGNRKTHYFENVIHMDGTKLKIGEDLKVRVGEDYHVGLLEGYNFENEKEIKSELPTVSVEKFFADLTHEVEAYYESSAD